MVDVVVALLLLDEAPLPVDAERPREGDVAQIGHRGPGGSHLGGVAVEQRDHAVAGRLLLVELLLGGDVRGNRGDDVLADIRQALLLGLVERRGRRRDGEVVGARDAQPRGRLLGAAFNHLLLLCRGGKRHSQEQQKRQEPFHDF